MNRKFTPETLVSLLSAIDRAELDLILVGGQSINLWANYYAIRVPELREYIPFASEDLDFYGGKVEAIACQRILGGTINLNQDFDPSPNTGVLIVPTDIQPLRVDFLGSVYGIGDVELAQSAIVFEGRDTLAGVRIKILNPMLCLEGKLKSTLGLPQGGRQDFKHLQMSLLFVKEYIKDALSSDVRQGLKLIERIAFNIWSDAGLTVWYRYGVEIESTIPSLSEVSISDRKWDNFSSVRLPQIAQEIIKKRERYLEARVNIEARVNRDDSQLTDRVRRYRELKQLGAERVELQGLHPDLRVAKIAIEGGIDRSEIIEILDSGDCMSSWSPAIIEGYRQRYLQQVFTRV